MFFLKKNGIPLSSSEYLDGGSCQLLDAIRDFTIFEPVTYGLHIGNMPLADGWIDWANPWG